MQENKEGVCMNNFDKFIDICQKVSSWNKKSLPLCAAENAISPFSQIPLDTFLQEKYIMGGVLEYNSNNNFIGSSNLYEFYDLINKQCATLFSSKYADPRTLSGVNAVTTLLMSLFKEGDTILISNEDCGGHSSMPKICHRLGIRTIELPYNYDKYDFDYSVANELLHNINPAGILICLSDMLSLPKLYNFKLPKNTILIFDATQILGLIAGRVMQNPFEYFSDNENFILMGATHKTLPGPTCGLIMTRNKTLARQFDEKINPDYLRNNQFHHILSLSLTLLEMEYYGNEYAKNVVANANLLGANLESNGFDLIHFQDVYTQTHQLFISMPEKQTKLFLERCECNGITLNARYKKLYRDSGIRIGTQEVTRYGWGTHEMKKISEILTLIANSSESDALIKNKIATLSRKKNIEYSFSQQKFEEVYSALHYH